MLTQVMKYPKEAIKILENISNSPSLAVLSKNAIDGKVQTFFHLFSTGNNILKKEMKFGALMGFEKEATTILIDPISAFKYSSGERPIPPFKTLLQISTTEEIMALIPDSGWSDKAKSLIMQS